MCGGVFVVGVVGGVGGGVGGEDTLC